MTVHAPYRFAPIHRWVWLPRWHELVSHDVPFKNGLSGEIVLEIKAETPLLVGGPRRKPSDEGPGEVWPFETIHPETGRPCYAITGSSLQGMIRGILEIATFGRLGPLVAERRFGLRDISASATGIEHYRGPMTRHPPGAGWLIKDPTGTPCIVPSKLARIDFAQLAALTDNRARALRWLAEKNDANERYGKFLNDDSKSFLNRKIYLDRAPIDNKRQQRAFASKSAGLTEAAGTIIFTGKPQSGTGRHKKNLEFVFHSPDRSQASAALAVALPLSESVWRDFLYIHAAQLGRDANPNWRFWQEDYEQGLPVPIFYLSDDHQAVTTLGTAFMFKAALPLSTHDMLRNSTDDHLIESPDGKSKDKRLDLPSLIFGYAADASELAGPPGLKRRASFDPALCKAGSSEASLVNLDRATLLEPKPSFYPSYVRQPGDQATGTLDDPQKPFALYSASNKYREPERTNPELAGVKIWPARGTASPGHSPQPADSAHIQSTLHALPAGTAFSTTLRVHNLLAVELGALLWALTFEDETAWQSDGAPKLRHRLGMGKPYSLGEISISVKGSSLVGPSGTIEKSDPKNWIDQFIEAISHAAKDNFDWKSSVQVQTLVKAADPKSAQGQRLDYMKLSMEDRGGNDFQIAKNNGRFLPRYAGGSEARRLEARPVATVRQPPRPAPAAGPPETSARRMLDYHEGVDVTFHGPSDKPGYGRVDYGDGQGIIDVPLSRLRSL